MAMETSGVPSTAGRLESLERENAELREQLRRYAAAQTVAKGAVMQAEQEREATARIAHQLVVEEQATRAAVEVQSGNTSFAAIMQIINVFLLVILVVGLFFWLPRALYSQTLQAAPAPNVNVVQPAPGGGTHIIPAPAR